MARISMWIVCPVGAIQRKTFGKCFLNPQTGLGRILVPRRFAFATNWWGSCSAIAFALSAIVDVRRRLRRHEMIFFNISETIRASDFKIYHNVALDSLYISTGNDVTSYFRSAANQTNVQMFGDILVAISR